VKQPKPGFWRRVLNTLTFRASVYEGAAESRTRRGWTRSNVGPNTAATHAPTLRARARDLVRNDAHAARALQVIAGNVVGTGIQPRFIDDADQAMAKLWRQWSRKTDKTGRIGLDTLQLIAMRAAVQDGECFVVRRISRRVRRGLPLRIEILEADYLDETRNEQLRDGGSIVQGIEMNADGEVVAYHFRTAHPGDNLTLAGASGLGTVRILAEDVIHVYLPLRPQQMRGISFLAPSMTAKVDLGDYERFHLTSKKMEAAMTGFVLPGDNLPPPANDAEIGSDIIAHDADGAIVEKIEPGLLAYLPNGKDIRFSNPAPVAGYSDYKRSQLQTIAVGWGVTYELMTGDLSQVNYSSLRAGMLEFWRFVDILQWSMFIPTFNDGVLEWFAEAVELAGGDFDRASAVEWVPPKRSQVDPSKDLLADYLRVRAGFAGPSSVTLEHGYTAAEVAKDWAEWRALMGGEPFDIDPKTYQWRGAAPANAPPLPQAAQNEEES
jgi:lambda family phage portal protein